MTQIAADKGWRIREVRPERASAVWNRWKARPGLWIGTLLALLFLLAGSQRVWRVEIAGAGPYQADLAAYLAEEGVRPGMLRTGFDAAALEESLTWRYPETAWFHVYVSGMTLRVECTRAHPMPELASGQPGGSGGQPGTAWWRPSRCSPEPPPFGRETSFARDRC